MSQQRPQGRRRASGESPAPSQEPASFADLARMWRSVSHAHAALEDLRHHFANTPADDRLADQLSLVPILHDQLPATQDEARELTYLLELFADPPPDAPRGEIARAVDATIPAMAARRGHPRVER